MDTAPDQPTVSREATTPTGFLAGNPLAMVNIFIEPDTVLRMAAHIMEGGHLRRVEAEEVNGGELARSVIIFGTGGVNIFARREDLVRLLVALSEHLDALDRADTTDRKVAEKC